MSVHALDAVLVLECNKPRPGVVGRGDALGVADGDSLTYVASGNEDIGVEIDPDLISRS